MLVVCHYTFFNSNVCHYTNFKNVVSGRPCHHFWQNHSTNSLTTEHHQTSCCLKSFDDSLHVLILLMCQDWSFSGHVGNWSTFPSRFSLPETLNIFNNNNGVSISFFYLQATLHTLSRWTEWIILGSSSLYQQWWEPIFSSQLFDRR